MLFLMRGASCSGKDTFIEQHFEPHTVLSSDWYLKVLTNDLTNQQQNGLVFETIHQLLEHRLKNRVPYTVINATNLKMKACAIPLELAEKYGEKVSVISIDPPSLEELKHRSDARGASGGLFIPHDVLERHFESYFTAMPTFMEKAIANQDFLFARVDQNQNVLCESLYEVRARVREFETKVKK